MKFAFFYHSMISDWNHGNAHFLRGVVGELLSRGHEVRVFEPRDAWSVDNLLREHGAAALADFQAAYPRLRSHRYGPELDFDEALDGIEVVLVHEWNDPDLVARIGAHRARLRNYILLFHDTHHRAVTAPEEMAAYDLSNYDGVLAFGAVIRDLYLERGWAGRAFTWHEAADVRTFRPRPADRREGDLVWIGNWGDDEREDELRQFLLEPVQKLGLRARVHGVRYPDRGRQALDRAGVEYAGWLPNHRVPEVFGRFRVTVHVPRRPYVRALPGIPTIRPFEAMACGIPLVSSPWDDCERLFTAGEDYLVARDSSEMLGHLRAVLADDELASGLAERGRKTIEARHTCDHRVDELLAICARLRSGPRTVEGSPVTSGMDIAFFGSSLVSAYWNGAATYYRGIVRALAERGHRITFYEPDAFERQQHRDIDDPSWARVVVYPATSDGVEGVLEQARGADLVIKASGVGVFDERLEAGVLELRRPGTLVAFWDVDAPATLDRMHADPADPFRALVPRYDLIFTYGGGPPVVSAYEGFGARRCVPIYNALDPSTHHPVPPDPRFEGSLGFLGNRLPDRERRVEEFFLQAAAALPDRRFLLGGSGWDDKPMPDNVAYLGHVYTRDHNAFNVTPLAVLNISRDSMASYGFSPATRVFEAAGAGACLITDAWEGLEQFLEPGREVLVASDGAQVAEHLARLTPAEGRAIGDRARRRMLREHTYAHRALDVEAALAGRRERTAPRTEPPATARIKGADRLDIVILGLSITSSWGNGHATTYRGLVRELERRGHRVLFLERDLPWYAENRDLPEPPYGTTELYQDLPDLQRRFGGAVARADLTLVGSYVPEGVEVGGWVTATARGVTAFYDIDTPVTLAKLAAGDHEYLSPELIPRYDLYLSFTGGPTLDRLERTYGSPRAAPLYCSVDPELYRPEPARRRWRLGYMGTYSDDRQPTLERLILEPARSLPDERFVVAGPQYPDTIDWPANVERIEHLPPSQHQAFYNSMDFTLNITRRHMIAAGYSPSVRLFEAAACGVPIISDYWDGIETVFEPGREILLARSGRDVLRYLGEIGDDERRAIADRARARVLSAHTAAHRAATLERYVLEVRREARTGGGTAVGAAAPL